mmetsp:Transcript_65220/g.201924  ORF Transcript_65220/g.201924 Transcript_65220/m.201924 type:complete len:212 (+) Transcript_65220:738-1373(+)
MAAVAGAAADDGAAGRDTAAGRLAHRGARQPGRGGGIPALQAHARGGARFPQHRHGKRRARIRGVGPPGFATTRLRTTGLRAGGPGPWRGRLRRALRGRHQQHRPPAATKVARALAGRHRHTAARRAHGHRRWPGHRARSVPSVQPTRRQGRHRGLRHPAEARGRGPAEERRGHSALCLELRQGGQERDQLPHGIGSQRHQSAQREADLAL